MARAKRYTPEQIVAKLREHEKLQAQGLTKSHARDEVAPASWLKGR